MTRIGLMGCGAVATYGHMPAIQATPGLALASVYDPSAERLAATQKQFGVKHVFTEVEAFFRSDIDAVVITSPAPAHLANVLDAARHCKPVLCEKPLAMNEAEGNRMIDAMAAAGLPLYVGFPYRFAPPAMKIKQLIRENAIGRVRSLRLVYNWDAHGKYVDRDPARGDNPRRHGRMIEGGPMVDCGVHQIDLARWWLGAEITQFHGVGAWVDDYDSPDHVYVHASMDNGAHLMVEMSYSFGHTASEPRPHFIYELIGTEGVIRYDREQKLFELVNGGGVQSLEWGHEKGFDAMYVAFAHALETGEPGDLATAADGQAATRVALNATLQATAARVKNS